MIFWLTWTLACAALARLGWRHCHHAVAECCFCNHGTCCWRVFLSGEFMASAQRWPALLLSVAAGKGRGSGDAEHGALRLYQPGGA
jgi:hypothetical protein